ncbi:MAG: FAD binding domain-containing protein [Saprospiraceae bacterium]|nr:FAD binding domain-containing protein [Saprospiraceae bacterium]
MTYFLLNNEPIHTDLPSGMTVLDFVRYHKMMTGTKCGCREGDCGACTVLIGELDSKGGITYRSMTSCLTPLANVQGRHVVTVEGINPPGKGALSPVQKALVDESGTQCGFCTVGFVVSLTGFCLKPAPSTQEQAIAAIDGNICRCTGYKSIERATLRLVDLLKERQEETPVDFAIRQGIVPANFAAVPAQLKAWQQPAADAEKKATGLMIGGGTDLYVQRHDTMVHAPARHLFNQPRLRGIYDTGDFIEISGAATVSDLLESPHLQAIFPDLHKHLKLVSSTPIRNMATIAGNLVNASPIGDLTVWLLALDARIVLANGQKRELPLRDFYLGYKSLNKTADEVLELIRFRKPEGEYQFNFEKVSKRTHLDIATVNSAALLRMQNGLITEAHVSTGGVAPIPLYLKKTSAFLIGKPFSGKPDLNDPVFAEAADILQSEISPISDVRGSATYKRLLAKQLFLAHFTHQR